MSWKLCCTCPHLGKAEPFVCDLVQFRRVCRGMAVHTEVAGAKVVGEKDENCDGGTVEPLLAAPWLPAVLQCSQSKAAPVSRVSAHRWACCPRARPWPTRRPTSGPPSTGAAAWQVPLLPCFAEGWQAQLSELSWLAGAGVQPRRVHFCEGRDRNEVSGKHDFNHAPQICGRRDDIDI